MDSFMNNENNYITSSKSKIDIESTERSTVSQRKYKASMSDGYIGKGYQTLHSKFKRQLPELF